MTDLSRGTCPDMPSSITRLTTLDHERLLRLLRRTVTEGPSQPRWRDELVRLVAPHRVAEQEALTADAVAPAGQSALTAAEDLSRLDSEMARVADELAEAPGPSPEAGAIGQRLRLLIDQHASLLSGQVLAPLESAVARKDVRLLGGVYEARRDADLREHGDADPPPRRFDVSRAELYELARRAGIEGRSAMSRKDLIAELQRREATT
jgi:hypothetical protein